MLMEKKFKIYELDDLHTFKQRVALDMKTVESFLYFPNGISVQELWDKKNDIIVINLLNEIKNSAKNNLSIIDLVENIRKKIGKIKFDRGKNIIKIWLAYNEKLKKRCGDTRTRTT